MSNHLLHTVALIYSVQFLSSFSMKGAGERTANERNLLTFNLVSSLTLNYFINVYSFQIGLTAVHLASASGFTDIIDLLVKNYNASLDAVAIVSLFALSLQHIQEP